MPSGAKKRKAARKKLEKEAHSFTKNNSNGSHHSNSQGSDDPSSHSERERNIDPVSVEKGENFEGDVVNDHDKGSKESSFDAHDDATREFKSVTGKVSSSSSSTSSSSDDDELAVEKDEPEEEPQTTPDESVVASMENLVDDEVEESIPIEESVKEVVSLPVSESAPVDQSLASDVIESELESKQFVDEKSEVGSGVTDVIQEKIEEKVTILASGSENTPESVGVVVVRDTEVVSPQSSSDVTDDKKGEMPETHKHSEHEPLLLSTAPMPVLRQTSIFNCCGLFEVFSGESSSR